MRYVVVFKIGSGNEYTDRYPNILEVAVLVQEEDAEGAIEVARKILHVGVGDARVKSVEPDATKEKP